MENSCGMYGRLWGRPQSVWWIGYTVLLLFIGLGAGVLGGHADVTEFHTCSADIALTYRDPHSKDLRLEEADMGRYGMESPCESEWGTVVHVRTAGEGANHGCTPILNVPSKGRWIALVQRGQCKFKDKIYISAVVHNASAVVIYNHEEDDILTMDHDVHWVVAVFIKKRDGERIARLVDSGVKVNMNISVGQVTFYNIMPTPETAGAGPPLLAISLSLVGLLILGLSAMLIYIVRRSRYARRTRNGDNASQNIYKVLTMNGTTPAQQEEGLLTQEGCHRQGNNTSRQH